MTRWTIALVGAALSIGLAYGWAGPDLVERAWNGESFAWLNELYAGPERTTLRQALRVTDEKVVLAYLLFGITLLSILFWRWWRALHRSRWAVLAALVGLYVFAEAWLAPRLARPLRLDHYTGVQDPDHLPIPSPGEPGWNSDRLRQVREPEAYREEDFNVIFLGDSFTAGHLLARPHVDAFPQVVERLLTRDGSGPEIRIANFGWPSSSPLLSGRRLASIGAKYHPDLVVLCVDMTDPHDDIKWLNLIERRGICAWYDRIPLAIKAFRIYLPRTFRRIYDESTGGNLPQHRYFHTEQPLEESLPFLRDIEANIASLEQEARGLGASFAVVVLPRWFQTSERECPNDWEMERPESRHTVQGPYSLEIFRHFDEWRERASFPILSLLDDFREADRFPLCFDGDPHWNEAGHHVAAEGIVRQWTAIHRDEPDSAGPGQHSEF